MMGCFTWPAIWNSLLASTRPISTKKEINLSIATLLRKVSSNTPKIVNKNKN